MTSEFHDRLELLRKSVDECRDKIFSGAAKGVDPETYTALFYQAVGRNRTLLDCTIQSLIIALTDSAVLGLPINSIEGQGYLVPRRRSVKEKDGWRSIWEAHFMAGYLGKLQLAYDSPLVGAITVEAVRDGDHLKVSLGTEQTIEHEPRGGSQITHVYAVMWLTTGFRRCVIWTTEQIQEHSQTFVDQKSRESDKSAWTTSWKAMACKTVLLNLLKYAPVSDRARRVMQTEEYADAGAPITPGLLSGDTVSTDDLDKLSSDGFDGSTDAPCLPGMEAHA